MSEDEQAVARGYETELREIAGMVAQLSDGPTRWKQYRLVAIADWISSLTEGTEHVPG